MAGREIGYAHPSIVETQHHSPLGHGTSSILRCSQSSNKHTCTVPTSWQGQKFTTKPKIWPNDHASAMWTAPSVAKRHSTPKLQLYNMLQLPKNMVCNMIWWFYYMLHWVLQRHVDMFITHAMQYLLPERIFSVSWWVRRVAGRAWRISWSIHGPALTPCMHPVIQTSQRPGQGQKIGRNASPTSGVQEICGLLSILLLCFAILQDSRSTCLWRRLRTNRLSLQQGD